ncbi:MAG TPA: hypothetical protein VGI86_13220 [Acidimicrobiia bacterium]
MAMRSDCKHYESRTYGSGETVRKCKIDLAPEAPWNCPADCAGFQLRMVDAGWHYGSLAGAMGDAPAQPDIAVDADVAALLDAAEDIVNTAGAGMVDEFRKRDARPVRGRKFGAKNAKKKKKKR